MQAWLNKRKEALARSRQTIIAIISQMQLITGDKTGTQPIDSTINGDRHLAMIWKETSELKASCQLPMPEVHLGHNSEI